MNKIANFEHLHFLRFLWGALWRLTLLCFVVRLVFAVLTPQLNTYLNGNGGWQALLWGIRFDLTSASLLITLTLIAYPLFCWSLTGRKVWLVCGFPLAAFWVVVTTYADAIYYFETGRHVTFEVFTASGLEGGLVHTSLVDYPLFTAAFIILVAVAIRWWYKSIERFVSVGGITSNWKGVVVIISIWFGMTVTAVRGGWSDAPQTPMSAFKIGNEQHAALAWGAPYAIGYYLAKGQELAAVRVTEAPKVEDYPLLAEMFSSHEGLALDGLKPSKVVVVLLESWSAVDSLSYSGIVDATPNFDRLRAQGLTTRAMYANGYRTNEGIFSVFCSYPNPVGGGVAGTQLQAFDYRCLPELLAAGGWHTEMVQGSGKGVVGDFSQSIGFEHSYGKEDFTVDGPMNKWGYMDEVIYAFAIQRLQSISGPALVAINTGTTHDSVLPDGEEYVFGVGSEHDRRRSILHHADAALGRFVDQLFAAIQEPLLLVLVADHTKNPNIGGLSGELVPFVMLANRELRLGNVDVAASQRDIAPTIMDWLGGNVPWFTGHSLLDDNLSGIADFSKGRTWRYVYARSLYEVDAANGELMTCHDVGDDKFSLTARECTVNDKEKNQVHAAFMRHTQSMLFSGKTSALAEVDTAAGHSNKWH